MKTASILQLFMTLIITALCAVPIAAQTTAFTYQGKLSDNGNPANGAYDMQFKLFDALSNGNQIGATIEEFSLAVNQGSFSVSLNFGSTAFAGADRFLEIGVRPAGSPNPYTVLSPRQPINSAPYAVSALQLGGLPASRYVATDANGKVGIGTATPSTKLEVVDPVRQLRFGPTSADNGGYLISTVPHQAIIIGGAKWDAPDWIARDTVASMTAHQFGAIEFYTNSGLAEGNPFSPALRMRIDSNGRVGIGTGNLLGKLTVDGGSDPGVSGRSTDSFGVRGDSIYDAGVSGSSSNSVGVSGFSSNNIGVYGATGNSASFAGYFEGNVRVTGAVIEGSDARLKQNISTLGYGLAEVLRLRPVTWRWKEHPERGQQLGLVAQEVEPVLPELVSTSKDAEQMKGLNYTGLIPVLVNAIKEQQQQLDQQQTHINQQQALDRQQQTQLAAQQTQIKQQQGEIAALQQQLRQVNQTVIRQQQREMAAIKRLLCASRPRAAICKAKALK